MNNNFLLVVCLEFVNIINAQVHLAHGEVFICNFARENDDYILIRKNHENITINVIDNGHITIETLTGKRRK